MIDKEYDTVKVQFDEESQECFISSPLIEKYFSVGDTVEWSQKSHGVYILTKAKE